MAGVTLQPRAYLHLSTKRTAGHNDHRPAARRSSGGMPGDDGAGNPCRTVVRRLRQLKNNRRTTESPLAARAWGRRAAKRFPGVPLRSPSLAESQRFRSRPSHGGHPAARCWLAANDRRAASADQLLEARNIGSEPARAETAGHGPRVIALSDRSRHQAGHGPRVITHGDRSRHQAGRAGPG
jgi:hypothetical protein